MTAAEADLRLKTVVEAMSEGAWCALLVTEVDEFFARNSGLVRTRSAEAIATCLIFERLKGDGAKAAETPNQKVA